jgi:hypothetical protein
MRKLILLWVCSLVFMHLSAQQELDIVAKHIEAVGGEKSWAAIERIRVEGIVYMEGLQINTTKQVIRNKGYRNDMVFEGKIESFKNNKFYISIYKNEGWKYLPDSPNNQPEALTQDEIKTYMEEMDFEDPFIRYKEKGIKITYLSKENILEKDYYKFILNFASGKTEYVYIDASNYMIAKRVLTNSDAEDTRDYADYQTFEKGIKYPTTMHVTLGTIQIQKVIINPPIDEKLFQIKINP